MRKKANPPFRGSVPKTVPTASLPPWIVAERVGISEEAIHKYFRTYTSAFRRRPQKQDREWTPLFDPEDIRKQMDADTALKNRVKQFDRRRIKRELKAKRYENCTAQWTEWHKFCGDLVPTHHRERGCVVIDDGGGIVTLELQDGRKLRKQKRKENFVVIDSEGDRVRWS